MKYLYAASIHGIQSFIFETNKLKEMIGASDMVEQICTDFFNDFLKNKNIAIGAEDVIRNAAGNIRLVCNSGQIETIVKYFPKAVQEYAPGIGMCQAVEKFSGNLDPIVIQRLEERLKTQRNKSVRPYSIGLIGMARSPRTGKPACKRDDDGKLIDLATSRKIEHSKPKRLAGKLLGQPDCDSMKIGNRDIEFPLDMEHMVKNESNRWIAVIHADGNNLGKLLQQLGTKLQTSGDAGVVYRQFSVALNDACCNAAKEVFSRVVVEKIKNGMDIIKNKFPLRPIVLGGDDLTLICRADLAIEFTSGFLREFQKQTKARMKELVERFNLNFQEGLTACAGIAFVKETYPFHYAYHLAEQLCAEAKKASKKIDANRVPGSLAFHKVHSSFQDDYASTIERELMVKAQEPIYLNFGPYGVDNTVSMPQIEALLKCVHALEDDDSPKSGLRQWLSELYKNVHGASQMSQRIHQIAQERWKDGAKKFDSLMQSLGNGLSLANPIVEGKTPVYDILTLLSLGEA